MSTLAPERTESVLESFELEEAFNKDVICQVTENDVACTRPSTFLVHAHYFCGVEQRITFTCCKRCLKMCLKEGAFTWQKGIKYVVYIDRYEPL